MVLVIIFWVLWIVWGLGLVLPLTEPWSRAHSTIGWFLTGILGFKLLGGFL